MNRLFLIDGHALMFRMYYAFIRRPMINSRGEDTSVIFGFTRYLLEMIARERPTPPRARPSATRPTRNTRPPAAPPPRSSRNPWSL